MPVRFSNIPNNIPSAALKRLLKKELDGVYPRLISDTYTSKLCSELNASFDQDARNLLHSVLEKQHSSLKLSSSQQSNLDALATVDGFTVVTGQQIHPFLGPAFVWAKVMSVIDRAQKLSDLLQKKVVPVFWMATEDHDFEEIQNIPFLGKSYTWEAESGGPVGDLDTAGIADILSQMKVDFQHDLRILEFLQQFDGVYGSGVSLTVASRLLIHRIFGSHGLLIIDPKESAWKESVKDMWLRELTDLPYNALQLQSKVLEENGLKVPITPRQTAMFYYGNGKRLRVDQVGNLQFQTSDASFKWTRPELEIEIDQFPDRFSANALLRPAYQQRILPNLVYIGGPAECMYWLQVPGLITAHKGHIPVLDLRLMLHLGSVAVDKKIVNFPWDWDHWFETQETLLGEFMQYEYGNLSLNQTIPELKAKFELIWESLYQIKHPKLKELKKEHEAVIRTLQNTADTFLNEGFEGHLAPKIKQLKNLKETVFNEKKLQERSLFWMEWQFKLNGIPAILPLQNRFAWVSPE